MARSNYAKKQPTREEASQIHPETVKLLKEAQAENVKDIFAAVKERAQGKTKELSEMQASLMDLINKIPDEPGQNGAEFNARIKDFGVRFEEVKKHLDNLSSVVDSEDSLEEVPVENVIDEGFAENSDVAGMPEIPSEYFNLKNGVGEQIDEKRGVKMQGKFKDGKLVDGFVVNLEDGRPVEHWKNGEMVDLQEKMLPAKFRENLPAKASADLPAKASSDLPQKFSESVPVNSELQKKVDQMDEVANSEKVMEAVGLVDARGQVLNGTVTPVKGEQHFSGKIQRGIELFDGLAVLDKERRVFVFEEGTLTRKEFGNNILIQKGRFKDGGLLEGDKISIGKGYSGFDGVTKSVGRVVDGNMVERTYSVENNKDKKGVSFTGDIIDNAGKDYIYVGDFVMPNGSIYKGEAVKNKKGEFEWLPGKKEMVKAVGFKDNVISLFNRKKKEAPAKVSEEISADAVAEVSSETDEKEKTEEVSETKVEEVDVVEDVVTEFPNGWSFEGKVIQKNSTENKEIVYDGKVTLPDGSVFTGEVGVKKDNFEPYFKKGEMKCESLVLNEGYDEEPGENFNDGTILHGDLKIDNDGKDRIFSGIVKRVTLDENGEPDAGFETYAGQAIITENNIVKYHGKGEVSTNHDVLKGIFENGQLQDGEIRSLSGKLIKKISGGKEGLMSRTQEAIAAKFRRKESTEDKAERSKEKGRLGKVADVVFSREGAKIGAEFAYKTFVSLKGVKLATDIGFAVTSAVAEKAGFEKFANRAGEFSDVHKFLVGGDQIKGIKEGFSNFARALESKAGGATETNTHYVESYYSDLKSKIENANQLDPKAKEKFLKKLEVVKQNFDAENKALTQEEENQLKEEMEVYLVKKVAGMQLIRDGLNGAAQLAVFGFSLSTGGVGGALTLAAKQAAALHIKQAAIARVLGMGTTKVVERMQKNKKFNKQKELEGQEQEKVGYLKDFQISLLETVHGLSGGVFNEGKDVKTGEQLTEMQRFANFGKSLGNVLVGVGVTLGVNGETISSVVGDFWQKFHGAKGGDVPHQMMKSVDQRVSGVKVKLPEGTPPIGIPPTVDGAKAYVPDQAQEVKVPVAVVAAEAQVAAAVVPEVAHTEVRVEASAPDHAPAPTPVVESAESSASGHSEILSVKDVSKVHDFASWRTEMMKSMGYNFHDGKIDHALRFHPGAKIELVGADGTVVDTYVFKKGGSTWDAMNKFHQNHGELFKGKDNIPGIHIVDSGDAKNPTVEVLDKYRVESHQAGQTDIKDGASVSKSTGLDKVISEEKAPKADLHAEKIKIGSNIQKSIPEGWRVLPDEKGLVEGFADDKGGSSRVVIYDVADPHLALAENRRTVDISSGRIFDTQGQHVGNLNLDKNIGSGNLDNKAGILDVKSNGSGGSSSSVSEGPVAKTGWSKGDAVDPTFRQSLEAMIHPSKSGGGSVEVPSAVLAPSAEVAAPGEPTASVQEASARVEAAVPTPAVAEAVPVPFKGYEAQYQTLQTIERSIPEVFAKNLNINLDQDKAGVVGSMLKRVELALSTAPSLLDNPDMKNALGSVDSGMPMQDRLKNIMKVLDSTNSLVLTPEERILLGGDFVKSDDFDKFDAKLGGEDYKIVVAKDGSGAISMESVANHAKIFQTDTSLKFDKNFIDLVALKNIK